MQSLRIMTLDLRAPLKEEGIAAYRIDPAQAASPAPDAAALLAGPLDERSGLADAGAYLFLQLQGEIEKDELADCAAELQKEGLWRGLEMEGVLLVRTLEEERGKVTQLLRPIVRGGRA